MSNDKTSPNLKMLVVLTGICLISATVLGTVYTATFRKIEINKGKNIESALKNVLPGTEQFKKISDDPIIFAGKKNNELIGYTILAEGMGFQGEIILMLGFDASFDNITGVMIIESVETPGVGDKIKQDSFLNQFNNMKVPDSGKISLDAVTGATISSVSVEKIINRAIKDVKRIF